MDCGRTMDGPTLARIAHLALEADQQSFGHIALCLNPLIDTLKPQSNGPSCSNTVINIGLLAVNGWAVTFGTAMSSPPSPLLAVPNVTAHPSRPVYQFRIIRCETIHVIAFGV